MEDKCNIHNIKLDKNGTCPECQLSIKILESFEQEILVYKQFISESSDPS